MEFAERSQHQHGLIASHFLRGNLPAEPRQSNNIIVITPHDSFEEACVLGFKAHKHLASVKLKSLWNIANKYAFASAPNGRQLALQSGEAIFNRTKPDFGPTDKQLVFGKQLRRRCFNYGKVIKPQRLLRAA